MMKPKKRRGNTHYDRDPKPLGAVSRRRRKKCVTRFVKVRMDGPISGRWIPFALWWWRTHRGPVPAGYRVAHLDGNTLNDDPSNFGLVTPGDVLFIAGERRPEMWEINRRRCSAATSQFNRDRAAIRRARELLPSCWYVLSREQRWLLNRPRRSRHQALLAAGIECDVAKNGRIRALATREPIDVVRGSTLDLEIVRHFQWKD